MRLTPNSGSGRIKGDARTVDGNYVEIKDADKQYTMKGQELLDSWLRSAREGIECEWIVTFKNGIVCRIRVERSAY